MATLNRINAELQAIEINFEEGTVRLDGVLIDLANHRIEASYPLMVWRGVKIKGPFEFIQVEGRASSESQETKVPRFVGPSWRPSSSTGRGEA